MLRKSLILFLFFVCLSSFAFALEVDFGENIPQIQINEKTPITELLEGNNNWTGVNTYYNLTIINYTILNATGDVYALGLCLEGVCLTNWDWNESYADTVYARLDGTNQPFTSDVDLGSNKLKQTNFEMYNDGTNQNFDLTSGEFIFSGGNVGIGTTTPGEKLEIDGNLFLNGDNDKILLGTGKDASIYYDSANLIINPKEVGTGRVIIPGSMTVGDSDAGFNLVVDGGTGYGTLQIKGDTAADFRFKDGGAGADVKEMLIRTNDGYFTFNSLTDAGAFKMSNILRLNHNDGSVSLKNDNQNLYFGAGDDASITYNGTNLVINPREVGAGNTIFSTGDVGIGTTDLISPLTILNNNQQSVNAPKTSGLTIVNTELATSTTRKFSGIYLKSSGWNPSTGTEQESSAYMFIDPQINNNPTFYIKTKRGASINTILSIDYNGFFYTPFRKNNYRPGAVANEGVWLVAGGAALSTAPNQFSPYIKSQGRVWDTTTSSSKEAVFITYVTTYSGVNPSFSYDWFGGFSTDPTTKLLSLMNNGDLKLVNDNQKLIQGTTDTYSQYFDGTDQNFDLTSGDFNFNANTNIIGNLNQTSGNATINNIYAGMWFYNETGLEFNIASSGVYYNLTDGFQVSHNNGFIFNDTEDSIEAQVAGVYKIDWGISFSGGNNNLYGLSVVKNFNISDSRNCYQQRSTSATAVGSVGTTCLLRLDVGDKLNFQIDDEANPTANVIIYDLNVVALRVGN